MVSSIQFFYFENPLGVRNFETEGFSDHRIPARAKLLGEIVCNLTGTFLIVSPTGRLKKQQHFLWGGSRLNFEIFSILFLQGEIWAIMNVNGETFRDKSGKIIYRSNFAKIGGNLEM